MTLPYVELHLVDHCNLGCAGCSHFSPLALPRAYVSTDIYRDLARLVRVCGGVNVVRLMGGEPLLHPNMDACVAAARAAAPDTVVRLVTNGLLLPSLQGSTWAALRDARVGLDVSVYPPFQQHALSWAALARLHGVHYHASVVDLFRGPRLCSRGDTDPATARAYCRTVEDCPFVRDGRLYPCAQSALVGHLAHAAGVSVSVAAGLDLHAPGLTLADVQAYLDQPCETCRWCAAPWPVQHWRRTVGRVGVGQKTLVLGRFFEV